MSNEKHYPTHPGAEHPPTMCMEIPVEEYEAIKRENAELKAKLESVQASMYADNVDLGMKLRKTQCALWMARSRRAFAEARYNNQIARRYEDRNEKTIAECYDKEVAKWKNSDRKCRAKAEQYL